MGNLSNYVTVTISRSSVGLTRAGFGTLLMLSPNVSWTEYTRTYSNADATDNDATLTALERAVASQVFAQNPAPKKIKIGRLTNKPTLVYSLSVVTVRNSYKYEVDVTLPGGVPATVSYTSDSGALDAEIAAGLVTAINAVAGNNYIAAGSSSPITITADAAAGWFSITPRNVDDLKVAMTHADPGYAASLAAIKLADNDFYAIYNMFNSNAVATVIATWTEANKKLFMMDSNETDGIITAVTSSDTFDDLKTAARERTATFYHHRPDQFAGAALLGRCLPLTPGSETWADRVLSGVDPSPLSDTHRTNLENKNANGYESVGNAGLTFFGKVASGEWIDTIRFLDWLENDAGTRIFNLKRNAPGKIPFTNPGISSIESELRASFKQGERNGGIKPGWTTTAPDADDPDQVTPADKAARTLNGLYGDIELQGAIHIVNVRVNVVA